MELSSPRRRFFRYTDSSSGYLFEIKKKIIRVSSAILRRSPNPRIVPLTQRYASRKHGAAIIRAANAERRIQTDDLVR